MSEMNELDKKYLKLPDWFKDKLYDKLLPHQAAFCVKWFKLEEFKNIKFRYKDEQGFEKIVKVKDFGPNYFVVSGTGTGKSLIAYIAMISTLSEKGGIVIYTGNYKALINEQYEELKKLIERQNLRIIRKTGDFTTIGLSELGKYDIILATYESCEQILQNHPKWLDRVNLIVIDEVHTIGDEDRGPILESVIGMSLSLGITLIFLSATVGDEEDIENFAKNLNATLIDAHDFRLVPLEKFVLYGDVAYFDNGNKKLEIKKSTGRFEKTSSAIGAMRNFALWVLFSEAKKAEENQSRVPQIICFVRSRDDAVKNSINLVKRIKELLKMPSIKKNFNFEILDLNKIKEVKKPTSNIILADTLEMTIPYRVAFHSSSLTLDWRNYVEKLFKLGYIRVIWSTPTLSAGVNLPAQYTLIYPKIGMRELQINEYKQSIGRAGRPKYDKIGYGGIVVLERKDLKSKEENIKWYFENYVNAPTETIYSSMLLVDRERLRDIREKKIKLNGKLMNEYYNAGLLIPHTNFFAFILKLIGGGYASKKDLIIDFCRNYLLLFRQFPELPAEKLVSEAIEVLLDPYKIIKDDYFAYKDYQDAFGNSFPLIDENTMTNEYILRPLGELSIKTYLQPLTASLYATLATNKNILYRLFINKNENVIAKKLLFYIGIAPDFNNQVPLSSKDLLFLLNEYDRDISDESFILDYDYISINPASCYGRFGRPSYYTMKRVIGDLQHKAFMSWWVSLIAEAWINEKPIRKIEEDFNISFGNYQNFFGQNGLYVWLLQSAAMIAKYFKNDQLYKQLYLLSRRVEKGCKSDILPLTYLKNIGRDRARQLWRMGFKSIEDIANATPESIAKVKGLSLNLATEVIKQAKRITNLRNRV